jgi:thiamine biosynthesis protein ThiI
MQAINASNSKTVRTFRKYKEVININKKIGSYEVSSVPSAGCKFNPQYPETHAKPHEIQLSESKINIFDLVENSIENAEILKF